MLGLPGGLLEVVVERFVEIVHSPSGACEAEVFLPADCEFFAGGFGFVGMVFS